MVPAGGCFLVITAQDEAQIATAWEFEKYLYDVEAMAAWTIGTGYVPPRKDVAEAENGLKDFLAENEMMKGHRPDGRCGIMDGIPGGCGASGGTDAAGYEGSDLRRTDFCRGGHEEHPGRYQRAAPGAVKTELNLGEGP